MDRLTPIIAESLTTKHESYWAVYRTALVRIGGVALASQAVQTLNAGLPYKFGSVTLRVMEKKDEQRRHKKSATS